MKKCLWLVLAVLLPYCVAAQSNESYIRKIIGKKSNPYAALCEQGSNTSIPDVNLPTPMKVDTLLTPAIPFTPMVVGLYGYAKRLNDTKESFVLRNETHNYRISRIVLKLIYTTSSGEPLHNREETIECDLMPGESRILTIKSFDVSKMYYYYTMPPKRASGTPYRIKYDLLRYDVVVE